MKMRIGFDGCLVRPRNFGVGTCILELARMLARRAEAEYVFYVRDFAVWRAGLDGADPVHVRHVTLPNYSRWRALRILWQQLVLPGCVSRDRIDLFHATAYTMPIALKIPTVLSVFDCLAFERPELCKPATRLHYRALMPVSVRRASQVIVPSCAVRDEVLSHFRISPDRVVVIPPGVESCFQSDPTPDELEAVRKSYRLPDRFVLFVGNFEPKKNLRRLVAAFSEATRNGLEGELILVGGTGWGPDRRIDSTAARVRSLGFVAAVDLAVLYRLASEFVYPALCEGFGLPVLEAMTCGVAVVASAVPSVLESDPGAVVLVDPLSVSSIAAGLLRARDDHELRRRLHSRGPEVAAQFTWDRAADQTLAVYERASRDDPRH